MGQSAEIAGENERRVEGNQKNSAEKEENRPPTATFAFLLILSDFRLVGSG